MKDVKGSRMGYSRYISRRMKNRENVDVLTYRREVWRKDLASVEENQVRECLNKQPQARGT